MAEDIDEIRDRAREDLRKGRSKGSTNESIRMKRNDEVKRRWCGFRPLNHRRPRFAKMHLYPASPQ